MKIAVMTDSSAGVTAKEAQLHQIHVARMPLIVDGVEYLEGEGISSEELMKRMKAGSTVGTSQPPLGQFMVQVESLLEEFDHVIYLPISSKLSGTYDTACNLIETYNGKLTVIDTKFVSAPLWHQTLEVKTMIDQGISPLEIKDLLEQEAYMSASIIPYDIQYLKRGGRISPAAAAIANLLKIVPVLKFEEGAIDLDEKVRTFKKAIQNGFNKIIETHDFESHEWVIIEADADPQMVSDLVLKVEEATGQNVAVRKLEPIVLAHTGPGTLVLCVRKRLI